MIDPEKIKDENLIEEDGEKIYTVTIQDKDHSLFKSLALEDGEKEELLTIQGKKFIVTGANLKEIRMRVGIPYLTLIFEVLSYEYRN